MPQPVIARPVTDTRTPLVEVPSRNESYLSGVSWPAVIGGAFVSASLALILVSLGTGLGFSFVSPWSGAAASAATLGKAAIVWLILTQIMSSAMGGYLAGRLRTKWTNVHTDEVYFRDTAHGFLVWAVGMVITAALLVSAATSLAGRAAQSATSGTLTSQSLASPNAYYTDMLLRSSSTVAGRDDLGERAEVDRILTHALRDGFMSSADSTYLAQIVAARSGLGRTDAESRVANVFASAQQSLETSRKALAHLSLWLFVALLSGAFSASYAGIVGGRQRERIA